jgi:hypothetical protein
MFHYFTYLFYLFIMLIAQLTLEIKDELHVHIPKPQVIIISYNNTWKARAFIVVLNKLRKRNVKIFVLSIAAWMPRK